MKKSPWWKWPYWFHNQNSLGGSHYNCATSEPKNNIYLKSTQYLMLCLIFKRWNTSSINKPENSFLKLGLSFLSSSLLAFISLLFCLLNSVAIPNFLSFEQFSLMQSGIWFSKKNREVLFLTLNKQRQSRFEQKDIEVCFWHIPYHTTCIITLNKRIIQVTSF